MDDIAPALLKSVKDDFNKLYNADKTVQRLRKKMETSSSYHDANKLAQRYGELLSRSIRLNITEDVLPDGHMYYNIANKVIRPLLVTDYETVSAFTVAVQEAINREMGLGLNGIKPELNESRVQGFLDRLSEAEDFNSISWILGEPIVNYSQSVVDDTLKVNAEFQSNSGLPVRVVRTAEQKCCEWCSRLEGTYSYPDVPSEVFQRHENCRCEVNYDGQQLMAYRNRSGRANTFRA